MKRPLNEKLNTIMSNLTEHEKSEIYDYLRYDHVRDDVASHVYQEDKTGKDYNVSDETLEKVIDKAAARYVYQGDYDCNLDYWANIDNLVEECLAEVQNA